MKHEDDVGETEAEVTASGANASADAGDPTKEEMEAEFREDDKGILILHCCIYYSKLPAN